MTYTDPQTWITGNSISAEELNREIKDNISALKDPPTDSHIVDQGADYTTASTSFTDIDATNLKLTITTTGGDVLIGFYGMVSFAAVTNTVFLNITKDGTVIVADDGIQAEQIRHVDQRSAIAFCYLLTSLVADTYEFRMQWKVTASTVTLYAGAGTANADLHPQFWVREI